MGGAEAGTLTFMVGGSKQNFEKAQEILKLMGKNIVHCGEAGSGQVIFVQSRDWWRHRIQSKLQVVKVCNNLALAIEMIGKRCFLVIFYEKVSEISIYVCSRLWGDEFGYLFRHGPQNFGGNFQHVICQMLEFWHVQPRTRRHAQWWIFSEIFLARLQRSDPEKSPPREAILVDLESI